MSSLTEARNQVKAAEEANRISSNALAATVSASVQAGRPEFVLDLAGDGNERVIVRVPLINDGGTATRRLVYSMGCSPFLDEPADPFNKTVLAQNGQIAIRLAPKERLAIIACRINLSQWISFTQIRDGRYKKGGFAVFGRARYADTLNPEQTHRIEFCTTLQNLDYIDRNFTRRPAADFYECRSHNCEDDDCPADDPPPSQN
ncbi:hypothetical protein [Roseicella sp. DB1501]|uniref:hypothetical protein n=1 Tax=Roseicella sp. DB1501 TaxID=2730925 RepID=UPI0014915DD6|nr:hypothetical protein [Roseicella sp. DB1501]NOG71539.1 hypothetical protein [Roseicella sp. DB1501]